MAPSSKDLDRWKPTTWHRLKLTRQLIASQWPQSLQCHCRHSAHSLLTAIATWLHLYHQTLDHRQFNSSTLVLSLAQALRFLRSQTLPALQPRTVTAAHAMPPRSMKLLPQLRPGSLTLQDLSQLRNAFNTSSSRTQQSSLLEKARKSAHALRLTRMEDQDQHQTPHAWTSLLPTFE